MISKLNMQQWFLATLAVFVFLSIEDYLLSRWVIEPWHGELFPPTGSENIMVLRLWSYLGRLIFAGFFVLIYSKGFEGKPGFGEGIRYGILIGLLIHVPAFFANLVTTTLSTDLLVVRMILTILGLMLAGVLMSMIYKGAPKPA